MKKPPCFARRAKDDIILMQGTLIVLEGIDGSGKSTQYKKLCERLCEQSRDFMQITFPRYDKESSALLRAYLNGEFGSKPGDVNAFAASTFYAVDRYASFKTDWEQYFQNGGTVVLDRYTTSNACHQGSKIPEAERPAFLDWLYEFEFGILGLPKPSLVIYLDTDISVSRRQMSERQNETNTKADIHEKDFEYLAQCLYAGRAAAAHYGWHKIACVKDGEMRSIADIHEEVYAAASRFFK